MEGNTASCRDRIQGYLAQSVSKLFGNDVIIAEIGGTTTDRGSKEGIVLYMEQIRVQPDWNPGTDA